MELKDSKKYSVEIGGMLYTIRSDQDEALVQEASQYLQRELDQMLEKSSRITEKDAIILLALKTSIEYLKITREQSATQSKIASLVGLLDEQGC